MFVSLALLAAATPAAWSVACAGKDGWSDPAPPVRVFANVYDVGTCGITVLLITSPKGHILIDGGPPDAAPLVVANIASLGFRLRDVKTILSSHEHADHAGGIAELRRRSGARVLVLAAGRATLETGRSANDDPQNGSLPGFAPIEIARTLRDGEVVRVGPLALTAHATPGHSPGSTSWTWRSCAGATCLNMAYADSVSAVSAASYRFSAHPAYVANFRAGMARLAAIRCDLLLTPHPSASKMPERFAGRLPMTDPNACQAYAATGLRNLDERLAKEAVTK